MAKMTFNGNVFSHDLTGDGSHVASLDLTAAFPHYAELSDCERQVFNFAIKTASRNATAGKLTSEVEEAFKAVKTRFDSWLAGTWVTRSEKSGEAKTSLLAQAVAKVVGVSAETAAEVISQAIEDAIDAAGLDRDEESQKKDIRKIGSDIRATFKADPLVAAELAKLELEQKAAKVAKADEAAQGKESGIAALFANR